MTEFEKWYNELPIREDAEDFTLETQAKYRKGWEAAIKNAFEEGGIVSELVEICDNIIGFEKNKQFDNSYLVHLLIKKAKDILAKAKPE